jgi:glycosyltransferase involved in cell wall biosynthesis
MAHRISRVLFQSRTTLFSVPGGDTTQIVKTGEALRAAGVQVDVSTELEPDLSKYDAVHLFNLMRPQELFLQATNAKRQHKPIALSTIYGPYVEYDRRARHGPARLLANALPHAHLEYLKILARVAVNGEFHKGIAALAWLGYRGLQKSLVNMVDVFLPNSLSEMRRVTSDFPASTKKPFVVVPNAVDTKVFAPASVEVSKDVAQYAGCVLSVARIEGRKCQLELVRAMKDFPAPLVIIGKPAPNHGAYFERVRRAAGPTVHFLGHVEHHRLPEYYKAAKVHCLISWMETPGLSSLEAGAMGCNLVVTRKGDTHDYFGELASYCEPDSVSSIRSAIERAYTAEPRGELSRAIVERFSWDKAAEQTIAGYEAILDA